MLFPDIIGSDDTGAMAVSSSLMVYRKGAAAFVTDGLHHHEVSREAEGRMCAVIAADESWCAVAGIGLHVLFAEPGKTLAEPSVGRRVRLGDEHHPLQFEARFLWPLANRFLGMLVTLPGETPGAPVRLCLDLDTLDLLPFDGLFIDWSGDPVIPNVAAGENSHFFSRIAGSARALPLAVSNDLMVYRWDEEACVTDGRNHHTIGTFYGGPACAAVAPDNSWCAAGGAGIQILHALPGEPLAGPHPGRSVSFGNELRQPPFWVDSLWAAGDRLLGVEARPRGQPAGRSQFWQLDVDTLELTPLAN